MSDNWLRLIPVDPEFVPTPEARDRGRERLAQLLPDADEVEARISAEPEFVDAGTNLESVRCPRCGAQLDLDWAIRRIDEAYENTRFADLRVTTPCCGAELSLNDLDYSWPVGFARFVLDAMNPNVRDLEAGQIAELSAVLGTPLRRIWQHV